MRYSWLTVSLVPRKCPATIPEYDSEEDDIPNIDAIHKNLPPRKQGQAESKMTGHRQAMGSTSEVSNSQQWLQQESDSLGEADPGNHSDLEKMDVRGLKSAFSSEVRHL